MNWDIFKYTYNYICICTLHQSQYQRMAPNSTLVPMFIPIRPSCADSASKKECGSGPSTLARNPADINIVAFCVLQIEYTQMVLRHISA